MLPCGSASRVRDRDATPARPESQLMENRGRSSELTDGQTGVVVPVDTVEVIRTLNRQAKAGDVSAARELRAWMESHPEVDQHVDLAAQPAVIRDRLLRRLLAELAEEECREDPLPLGDVEAYADGSLARSDAESLDAAERAEVGERRRRPSSCGALPILAKPDHAELIARSP